MLASLLREWIRLFAGKLGIQKSYWIKEGFSVLQAEIMRIKEVARLAQHGKIPAEEF